MLLIRGVSRLSIGLETGYSDQGSSQLPSVPPDKQTNSISNLDRTASLHSLPKSLFTAT